jgi:flagellar biosynthesis/type III secretory pathway protein FliH
MAYEAREAELMDQRSRILSAEMKGMEKGREEGIEKGREEGIEKGREEGIEKGREQGVRVVAKNMLTRGMSVDDVAAITGMERNMLTDLQRQMQA